MEDSTLLLESVSPIGNGRGHRARCRAIMYSFLAQALSAPAPSLCRAIENGALGPVLLRALEGTPARYRRKVALACLDKIAGATGKQPTAALEAEYTRLFALNVLCPQYEADYISTGAENAVHTIAKVARFYSALGLRVADGVGERPDHIALELDFMSFLAIKEAWASERDQRANAKSCRRAQTLFLSSHLWLWGATFARSLADATGFRFYLGVRELLEGWLAAEAQYLRIERGVSAEVNKQAAAPSVLVNISNALPARR